MNNKPYPPLEDSPQMAAEPAAMAQTTTFTPAQVELLNAMAWLKTDDDVRALQHAISEFFAQRADDAMERLWANGTWNEQTLRSLRTAHYRTPYNKR